MIQLVEEAKNPENNIFIYDVRSTGEIRSTGKICEHAIMMSDPSGFADPSFEKPPLDATVVFSCRAGHRFRASLLSLYTLDFVFSNICIICT